MKILAYFCGCTYANVMGCGVGDLAAGMVNSPVLELSFSIQQILQFEHLNTMLFSNLYMF